MKKSSILKSKIKTKSKTSSQAKSKKSLPVIEKSSGNVFKELGFSDAESANLTARCDLLFVLQDIISKNGWSQSEAAKHLKVGQPRIAEIMHSQSKLFSVDLLIKYLARLQIQVHFKFSKLDWK